MLKEFKAFVMRGNVLDLAIGVIIGGAFGKIVTSLVDDVLMPPVGLVLGRVDFSNLFVALDGRAYASRAVAKEAGAPVLAYGAFLNTVIQFLIVALCVFFLVKAVTRLQREPVAQAVETKTRNCPFCVSVIPVEATRCPSCTSHLNTGEAVPAAAV